MALFLEPVFSNTKQFYYRVNKTLMNGGGGVLACGAWAGGHYNGIASCYHDLEVNDCGSGSVGVYSHAADLKCSMGWISALRLVSHTPEPEVNPAGRSSIRLRPPCRHQFPLLCSVLGTEEWKPDPFNDGPS